MGLWVVMGGYGRVWEGMGGCEWVWVGMGREGSGVVLAKILFAVHLDRFKTCHLDRKQRSQRSGRRFLDAVEMT